MFTESIGDGYKSQYTSPLAEEIIVSFEENLLGGTGDPATLNDRVTGDSKTAGDHDDFDLGDPYGLL